jgi:transposase-like protein
MKCPKCSCEKRVKSGIVKDRQRYKCKECGCNYTVELKSTAKPKSLKKQALHLYLEGMGFRSIGRFLGVSNVSVLNWIRSFGKEVEELSSESKEIEMVEVDEMHSYIGSKKTTVGYGLLLIDMEKDSSISLLATGAMKRQKRFGKK